MSQHPIPSPQTPISRKRVRTVCHALVAILVLQLVLPPGFVPLTPVEEVHASATLVGHYKLDEDARGVTSNNAILNAVSGGSSLDTSNFATTAPDSSIIAPVPGNVRSYNFDGSDDFMSSTNNDAYNLSTFSIAAWVRPDTAKTQTVVAKGYVSTVNHFNFLLNMAADMKPIFSFTNDTGSYSFVSATAVSAISLGSWSHLVGTYDGSTLKIYVNGVLSNSFTVGALNNVPTSYANDEIWIGTYRNNSGTAFQNFDGHIDDTRIYSGALTAGEVAELYDPSDTYSGTAFTDAGSTHVTDGTTINVLKDGVLEDTDTTLSGAFDLDVSCAEGEVLTFYVDGAATDAVTVTRCGTGDVTGINLYGDHLITRHEDSGPLTNANLDTGNDGDTDITNIYANSGGSTLTMASGKKLLVWTGDTFTPGGTVDANGNVTIQSSATLSMGSNSLTVSGDMTVSGTLGGSSNTVTFDGTTQTLNPGSATWTSHVVVSGTSTLTLSTNALTIGSIGNTRNLTINTSGTLNLAALGLTVVGTFNNNGNVKLIGGNSISLTAQDIDSGTWTYVGNGNSGANSYTLKDFDAITADYYNLVINMTDGTSDTVDFASTPNIAGDLTVTAGTVTHSATSLTVTGNAAFNGGTTTLPTGTFSLGGNWTKGAGTVNNANGTVDFIGTNQTITGTYTFYNLTATDAADNANSTLTFTASTTTTVAGALTLQGADSNDLLQIRSSSTGNGATINVTGSITAGSQYLDVKDNTLQASGVTKTPPLTPTGSTNSGNTNGWFALLTGVSATNSNDSYGIDDTIYVTVTFDGTATVTGSPRILLETGTTDRYATYASGSPGTTLTFQYVVQSGDVSADLDYVATNSLGLNGGTINDAGGNALALTLASPGAAGSLAANKDIKIDGIAPTVSTPDLATGSDSGASSSDDYTNDTTPTFTGTCESGSDVTLYVNGSPNGSAEACSGTYSFTPTLTEGEYDIGVRAEDAAGNTTDTATLPVTIDTTSPGQPSQPDLAQASDSGAEDDDDYTNIIAPTFTGTCTGTDKIALYVDTVLRTTTPPACTGTYSFVPNTNLTDGDRDIVVRATDLAGNYAESVARTVTIDTVAPTEPSQPVLETASDTGLSTSDGITNDTTPTVTGTCTDADTETVRLYADGVVAAASADCDVAETYTFTPAIALLHGSRSLTVRATDLAGNTADSDPLTITIDTIAPTAPSVPNLATADDTFAGSGTNSDDYTKDTTPAFTGTCTPGDKTTLIVDNSVNSATTPTCGGGGTYSIEPNTALSAAGHSIKARATDTAGNTSESTALPVTIDTSVSPFTLNPVAPVAGSSNPINVSGTCEPGGTVSVSNADELLTTNPTTGACSTLGTYSIAIDWISAADNTTNEIEVIETDKANNTSSTLTADVLYIENAPQPPSEAPDMTSATDSGINNDDRTNVEQPDFTGTCPDGLTTITLYVDNVDAGDTYDCALGGPYSVTPDSAITEGLHLISITYTNINGGSGYGTQLEIEIDTHADPPTVDEPDENESVTTPTTVTGECEPGAAIMIENSNSYLQTNPTTGTCSGAGTYSINVNWNVAANGTSQVLSVSQTDISENTSAATDRTVHVDLTGPDPPNDAPDLTDATDSGTEDDDDLTNVVTPTFAGDCTTNETVKLYSGSTLIGSQVCPGGGTYEITTPTLVQGNYVMAATFTSVGGESAFSPTNTITIDTTVAAPSAPDLDAAYDSRSNTDNYPNLSTLLFTGTCANGDTITLYVDNSISGTPTTCSGLAYSFTRALSATSHTLKAVSSDAAGNEEDSGTLSITIDQTDPTAPGQPNMADASDTGDEIDDEITSVTTPLFTGTCTNGDTVTLLVDGSPTAVTMTCAGGYSLTSAILADGMYDIAARATDQAGNTKDGTSLAVTIDTIIAAPVINAPSASDDVTNPTNVSGTCEEGATVSVHNALLDTDPTTGVCDSNDTFSIALTWDNAADNTTQILTVDQVDVAGNASDDDTVSVSVVLSAASPPGDEPDMIDASDTGTYDDDDLTKDTTPTFTGTCTAGQTVKLYIDGAYVNVSMLCSGGHYSLTPTALADDTYTVTVTYSNINGETAESPGNGIEIDTSILLPTINSPAEDDTVGNPTTVIGTCEPHAIVSIRNVNLSTNPTTGTCASNGTYSIAVTWDSDADGLTDELLTVDQADAAGNASGSVAVGVNLDLSAPGAPEAPDLTAASDSGRSDSDNVTNISTVTFEGTCTAGETVTLYDDSTALDSDVCSGGGTYSIVVTLAGDYIHPVAATFTSIGGESDLGTATNVTLDTFVDIPVITSPTDAESAYVIVGTGEARGAITVSLDGTPIVCIEGDPLIHTTTDWQCIPSDTEPGTYVLSAIETDLAGNTSDPTADITFTLTEAPIAAVERVQEAVPPAGGYRHDRDRIQRLIEEYMANLRGDAVVKTPGQELCQTTFAPLRNRVTVRTEFFSDVTPDNPRRQAILTLTAAGYMKGDLTETGVSTGTFNPKRSATFLDTMTVLLRARFADTDAELPRDYGDGWERLYLLLARMLGIPPSMGENAGLQPIKRGEFMEIVTSMFCMLPIDSPPLPYGDVSLAHPHAAAIATATAMGLIRGDDDKKETFRPDEAITREEFAQILFRALVKARGEGRKNPLLGAGRALPLLHTSAPAEAEKPLPPGLSHRLPTPILDTSSERRSRINRKQVSPPAVSRPSRRQIRQQQEAQHGIPDPRP